MFLYDKLHTKAVCEMNVVESRHSLSPDEQGVQHKQSDIKMIKAV